MVTDSSIEVVLPTYNGVNYLEVQLASIYAQSLRPWRVLIRDDGSTDGTQELIELLQSIYGSWLQVLPADGNLGCIANVNRLLEATQSSYVALADQDDIWQSDKLQMSLGLMQHLENSYGSKIPLLVHTDLQLINSSGESLGSRFFHRQRLDPCRNSPQELVFTNVVTGCTVLLNRSLLQVALPIPYVALMHDWWLSLVCSICGKIGFLDHPTVSYRQHDGNQIGSRGFSMRYILNKFQLIFCGKNAWIYSLANQAHYLETMYKTKDLHIYRLLTFNRYRRLILLLNPDFRKNFIRHGSIRTIALWSSILIAKQIKYISQKS